MVICWSIIGLQIKYLDTFLTNFFYKNFLFFQSREVSWRIAAITSILMNKEDLIVGEEVRGIIKEHV